MKWTGLLVILVTLLSAGPARAQGGNVGNGGLGGEPQFKLLRDLLVQWIELGALNLDTRRSLKQPVDWNEIVTGMRTIPVQFDPSGPPPTVGNSKDRACRNFTAEMPGGARIECHLELWKATPETDKLAVVFHEYLGVMGYEPNAGDFSQYPLSSQLLGVLLGESIDPLTRIDPKTFDSETVQPAPTDVLLFAKSLMGRKAEFTVQPDGYFHLKTNENYYRASELIGTYLKTGDYLLYGVIGKNFSGKIGTETLSIRQPKCPSIKIEMVYTSGLGIRSISTDTQCSDGDFLHGFEKSTTKIQSDGTVKVENEVVNNRKFKAPVEIRINGTLYPDRYVHPIFRTLGEKEKTP